MDLNQLATELLKGNMQGTKKKDLNSAIGGLLSGGDGKIDLGGIIGAMKDKGLGSIAESWLGDGGNKSISMDQLNDLLGKERVSRTATKLNTREGSLLESLSSMLPQLIDKSSKNGSLLESLGGKDVDLLEMATELFGNKPKTTNNSGLSDVLGSLLGGKNGKPDLGSIIASMNNKGLGSIAESWLGDGDNKNISFDQIKDILGHEKVSETATQLNTDEGGLLESLSSMLPQLIDKSSKNGSLLDSFGGADGIFDIARDLFKKR